MLFEKKTLFGLLVPWFTGCSAVSPGHWPFCARASISVPGAPASSLLTGSQVLVLNPGVEICAPDWVATALLCTDQPLLPRLEMSLAPLAEDGLTAAAGPWPRGVAANDGCPRLNGQLVRNLSKQTCQEGCRATTGVRRVPPRGTSRRRGGGTAAPTPSASAGSVSAARPPR